MIDTTRLIGIFIALGLVNDQPHTRAPRTQTELVAAVEELGFLGRAPRKLGQIGPGSVGVYRDKAFIKTSPRRECRDYP